MLNIGAMVPSYIVHLPLLLSEGRHIECIALAIAVTWQAHRARTLISIPVPGINTSTQVSPNCLAARAFFEDRRYRVTRDNDQCTISALVFCSSFTAARVAALTW